MASHDLYHDVINKETDLLGEGFVAGFTLAQIPEYIPSSIHLAAGYLHLAHFKTHLLDEDMQAVVGGWLVGMNTPQLFDVNWEALWQGDLNALRKKLNLEPKTVMNHLNAIMGNANTLYADQDVMRAK